MATSTADMLALAGQLPIPMPGDRAVFNNNLSEVRGRAMIDHARQLEQLPPVAPSQGDDFDDSV
jgi:hypothetical protein